PRSNRPRAGRRAEMATMNQVLMPYPEVRAASMKLFRLLVIMDIGGRPVLSMVTVHGIVSWLTIIITLVAARAGNNLAIPFVASKTKTKTVFQTPLNLKKWILHPTLH